MRFKLERKLPVILFFVFAVLAVTGIAVYLNTVSLREALKWRRETQETLYTADNIFLRVTDTERSVSAFVVTGNESYLQPFEKARASVPRDIATLERRLSGQAGQADELRQMAQAIAEYFTDAASKIELRRREGYEAAVLMLARSRSSALISQIGGSLERIKTHEMSTLQQRERSLDRQNSVTIAILMIGSIAGAIALVIANLTVRTETRRRQTAQAELVEANRSLEERVKERTEALRSANAQLEAVAAERAELLANEQQARMEAEVANRLRDEFMATVSHELRTPLNSILGWARMMKAGTLNDEQSAKAVNTIIKNSETQNRLIEDLLEVARLISGKLVLKQEEVDPLEVVRHSMETVRPQAEQKRVDLELQPIAAEGLSVTGDRERLVQVFSNLFANAVKFSDEGGKVEARLEPRAGNVEIRISDRGKGISRDFLPQVFERFRQDTVSTERNGGLGLGLAIVRNLVEMHGGSVSAESEGEGKGATFTITLPVAAPRAEP